MTSWYKVYDFKQHGNEPQALFSLRTLDIDGHRYCLGRLPDGYFAITDRCPHAGAPLSQGHCTHDGKVVCPVHRFTYDLKTGMGDPSQGDRTGTFPVEVRHDGVYIGLPAKSPWWKFWA